MQLEAADDVDDNIESVIKDVESKHDIELLHSIAYY